MSAAIELQHARERIKLLKEETSSLSDQIECLEESMAGYITQLGTLNDLLDFCRLKNERMSVEQVEAALSGKPLSHTLQLI